MAIQQMETGYKPEFGLGALYSGWNAGNTMRSNEEELLRQILANKQKEQEMPYDLAVKRLAGNEADTMNTPESIMQKIQGILGLAKLQQAQGQTAQEIQESDSASKIAENQNKTGTNLLDNMIRKLQLEGNGSTTDTPSTDQSGFPEGYGKGSVWPDRLGLSPNPLIPFGKMASQDSLRGTMDQEQNPLFSNMVNAAVNTPKHLQSMQIGEQRGLFGLENTRLRTAASLEAMKERLKAVVQKDPSLSSYIAKQYSIASGETPGDPERALATLHQIIADKMRVNNALVTQPIDIQGTQEQGKVVTKESAVEQYIKEHPGLSHRQKQQIRIQANKEEEAAKAKINLPAGVTLSPNQ